MSRSRKPVVVLMCGVAGSGKTTYAKRLEAEGFVRLSIDEEVWSRFGRFGVDYAPTEYAEHSAAAEEFLRDGLLSLIQDGRDVVVDFSFWQRGHRDLYKRLVEEAGARWRLVYLQVRPAELRRRLDERAIRFDANAAFPTSTDILESYLAGFEEPDGEGEEVISS
jgi:predicted kinase